jgi:hypothetical protein
MRYPDSISISSSFGAWNTEAISYISVLLGCYGMLSQPVTEPLPLQPQA